MDAAPGYEIFDDVCAAVFELARIDFVLGIVLGQFGGAKIGVPRPQARRRRGRRSIQTRVVRIFGGSGWPMLNSKPDEHMGENVPVVTTSTSRAAFSGPMRRTASVISSALRTTAGLFDTLVDFRNCLDNLMRRHNIFPRQLVGSLGGRRSVLLPLTVIISPSGSP